ncbi:MAG: tRNA adenosine(34) deaminase TadA [Streptosporangiaceae bacterium]
MVTGYLASFEPAMTQALAEAAAAAVDQEVPVGAVVLDAAGEIIGRGRNQRETQADPTAHAEILALRAAARARRNWHLEDCTLVVTLEPCTMCAGALLASRVARLVYGATDPRAGAAGSVWDVLHDPRLGPPVEVLTGVLAEQCSALIKDFFGRRR